MLLRLLVVLLIAWIALIVLGFVIKGLFWLTIFGIVLFLATTFVGWVRRNSPK